MSYKFVPRGYRDYVAPALSQGWTIKPTQKCHSKWYSPDGVHIVVCPGSPSDQRGLRNFESQLRKGGFKS